MAPKTTPRPGRRALRAQQEARRTELSARLADLLRALGLGASSAPELLGLARAGDLEGLRSALGRYSGRTEAEARRRREAETLALDLAALPD